MSKIPVTIAKEKIKKARFHPALTPIALFILMGMSTVPAMAASNPSLGDTIRELQREVADLKQQISGTTSGTTSGKKSGKKSATIAAAGAERSIYENFPPPRDAQPSVPGFQDYLPFDPDVPGQAFVSTGPYVGVPIAFAGSDLIINSPSVNTDVQLLNIRKHILNQLHALGGNIINPEHSHLLFSGVIEGQAGYLNPGGRHSNTDIDVTNVSLDATVFGPSDWLQGFIEFTYFNPSPVDDVFESENHYRVGDSRVLINKAFVTIGNFTCSPFYGTFGQFYVPFGVYSSAMVSDPLTKLVARTKARSILLGFQQQGKYGLYGAAYIFRGDTHAGAGPRIDNGGLNLGYNFDGGFLHGTFGGGVIANIADSAGMQLGAGFADSADAEKISHQVPAYDVHTVISLGTHFDFIGEYITTSKSFSTQDMTYEGEGAQPNAYDLQGSYSFSVCDKPSSVGLGFGKSSQALALGIPLTRTYLVFNTSLFRNTLQSLEFRHDREYAASDTATGPDDTPVPAESGKSDNAVTAQFDYYF